MVSPKAKSAMSSRFSDASLHKDRSLMLVCTRTEAALLLLNCNSLEGTEHHRVLDPEMILM